MLNYYVKASQRLVGTIAVPGDKSISHRALMLAAIADGQSEINHCLLGADNLATVAVLGQLGVAINVDRSNAKVIVAGVGLHGLQPPTASLELGNSGTAMRLLTGLLAGQAFTSRLVGDESLSRRPMARIVRPLRMMGADIAMSPQQTAPLCIRGGMALQGIDYTLPVASAQLKSCLLLAGLYAQGTTVVRENTLSRDHSERMLNAFGYPLTMIQPGMVAIRGGGRLVATYIEVPGDISSAAFFIVAATIVADSAVVLQNVGINPSRMGVINLLRLMGADITLVNQRQYGTEPIADIQVRSAKLKGIEIPHEQVPLAIDEFPVLFIAAACAEGVTVLTGAKELRVKESDRLKTMVDGLTKLGIHAEALKDGAIITGGQLMGGEVDSLGDHRVAMAFTVAACVAKDPVMIRDCANVATSFPDFVALAQQVGIQVRSE